MSDLTMCEMQHRIDELEKTLKEAIEVIEFYTSEYRHFKALKEMIDPDKRTGFITLPAREFLQTIKERE